MATGSATLDGQFFQFSKFGDSKSDGKTITLTNCDKWIKQAGIFNAKLTTTDTGLAFNKFKAKTINFKDFEKFVADLSLSKGLNVQDVREKLTGCGIPGTTNTTQIAGNTQVEV